MNKMIYALGYSPIANVMAGRYDSQHIRPLAVRPLNYSECVPNPGGFLFLGSKTILPGKGGGQ